MNYPSITVQFGEMPARFITHAGVAARDKKGNDSLFKAPMVDSVHVSSRPYGTDCMGMRMQPLVRLDMESTPTGP